MRLRHRSRIAGLSVVAAIATGPAATPAQAGLLDGLRAAANPNPVPLTDAFASALPPLTGGTTRVCATSGRGFTVRCVERVNVMPSAMPTASGVTFGHWIFCRSTCTGSLLVHELVHVAQFETHGDLFGPRYLAEAAVNGTGCENRWERPAYQTSGRC